VAIYGFKQLHAVAEKPLKKTSSETPPVESDQKARLTNYTASRPIHVACTMQVILEHFKRSFID